MTIIYSRMYNSIFMLIGIIYCGPRKDVKTEACL